MTFCALVATGQLTQGQYQAIAHVQAILLTE